MPHDAGYDGWDLADEVAQRRAPKPCLHTNTSHQHGTRAAYVADYCRCGPCTKANRQYEDRRRRAALYGRTDLIDAAPVREHVRTLMAAGIGHKRIAFLAGVSRGVVGALLYGSSGAGPSKRVRPRSAAALLAVEPPKSVAPTPVAPPRAVPPRLLRITAIPPRRSSIAELGDPDADWRASALCAQVDPETWFPEAGGSNKAAKKICARCPVRKPRDEFARHNGEAFGIYGGHSYSDRRKNAS